jgi:glucans biosynthesis protein C
MSSTHQRYACFDSLRAASMLYIVLWHAGMAYSKDFGWFVKDPSQNETARLIQWAAQGFTLAVFFVIAGFFARLLAERHGLAFLVRHRLKRILPALLVVSLIASGFIIAVIRRAPRLQPFHMWFLEYLLIISLTLPFGARAIARAAQRGWLASVDARLRAAIGSRWAPLVLALAICPFVIAFGRGLDGATMLAPIDSFVPDPGPLAYYALFYVVGWFLHRHADALAALSARFAGFLAAGIAVRTGMAIALAGQLERSVPAPSSLAMQIAAGVYTAFMVLGSVGAFYRLFRRDTALARYVSDASFWCYLAHPAPVLAAQLLLARLDAPAAVKYLLVVASTCVVLGASYEYLIRYTFVGAALNGRRERAVAPGRAVQGSA